MAGSPRDDPHDELSAIELSAIELRRVELVLAEPVHTALGTWHRRPVLLVRVTTGAGSEGWGECAALPEAVYSPETTDGAEAVLSRALLPRLAGAAHQGRIVPGDVAPSLGHVRGNRMAKAAVEAAVIDAALVEAGVPLWRYLGGEAGRVPGGVAVGIPHDRSAATLLATVDAAVGDGYRRVKVKIAPGWDREPLVAIREQHPGLALVADANGSYGRLDHRQRVAALAALDGLSLTAVEQPLGRSDLDGHAALGREIATPIALDESLDSEESVREALDRSACALAVVKAGRLGGLLAAARTISLCASRGVGASVGGLYETAVGRAGNVALATLPGCSVAGDIAEGSRYFAGGAGGDFGKLDPVTGTLAVPSGPGIGITVPAVLREMAPGGVAVCWAWSASNAGPR